MDEIFNALNNEDPESSNADLNEGNQPLSLEGGLTANGGKKVETDTYIEHLTQIFNEIEPDPQIKLWNLPHRNIHFTGRDYYFAQIGQNISNNQVNVLTQTAAGLGGIGKTQIAVEYAYRNTDKYDFVHFIRSEEPIVLAGDFARIARKANLSEKDSQDINEQIEAVKRWLTNNQNWLLIFDNAEDQQSIKRFLPAKGGDVIATTRNQHWGNNTNLINVQPFLNKESLEFLKKRTGESTDEKIIELAEGLGNLPLALELAAAYMEVNPILSINDYLELFMNRREQLWKQAQELHEGGHSFDYPDTVRATWEISMEKVKEESEGVDDLMKLFSLLAPEGIKIEMLHEGKEYLPERLQGIVEDNIKISKAIGSLRKYSLIEIEKETTSMNVHSLVQILLRDRMGEDKKEWVGIAVKLINGIFPYEQNYTSTWQKSEDMLLHGISVTEHAIREDTHLEIASRLLNDMSQYLSNARAEYKQAKEMFERAIDIEERIRPDEESIPISLSNLITVLKNLGEYEQAKIVLTRALNLGEKHFGEDHPKIAAILSNLGTVLADLGEYEQAKIVLTRALSIDEKHFGKHHPEVATDLSNLGTVLTDLGEYEQAKIVLTRALSIDEKHFGKYHPNVATWLNNLAYVYLRLGDRESAKNMWERTLKIHSKNLPPTHPYIQNTKSALRSLNSE